MHSQNRICAYVGDLLWKWKSLSCVQLFVTPWTLVHWILQARILEWVAYPFSSGSSWPSNQIGVSCIAGRFFSNRAMREAFWTYCLQKKNERKKFLKRVVMLRGRDQSQWKLRNGKFLAAHLVYLWAYVKTTTTLPKVLQNTWATLFRRLVVLRVGVFKGQRTLNYHSYYKAS